MTVWLLSGNGSRPSSAASSRALVLWSIFLLLHGSSLGPSSSYAIMGHKMEPESWIRQDNGGCFVQKYPRDTTCYHHRYHHVLSPPGSFLPPFKCDLPSRHSEESSENQILGESLRNEQHRCKSAPLLNGDWEGWESLFTLFIAVYGASLLCTIRTIWWLSINAESVINKFCPPSVSPCGVCLFCSPMGAIFPCKLLG